MDGVSDRKALFTIGELSRRTGLPVRTIRFWSDEGVTPETSRSGTGYRLYDAEAVARLDLVRTLRELGMDLATVKSVLRRQATMADVAAAHVRALDAEIRTLRVRRAVLRSVARRRSSTEEMRIMNEMAKLSAAERQQVIDEFVDETFAGVPADDPGARIAQGMRKLPADLPDDPSPEQVDAWVELAELVRDKEFRARTREMATASSRSDLYTGQFDQAAMAEAAQSALQEGLDPASKRAGEIVGEVIDGTVPRDDRARLADQLAVYTDRRVERYWGLLGILNGWPQRPSGIPAMEWFITALRAHAS